MAKAKSNDHKFTSYVIMDFETGGLEMDKCGLTEVAAIAVRGDTLEKIGEYESLIAPHNVFRNGNWIAAEYTQGAENVTGLTKQKLISEGQHIETVVEQLLELLTKANVVNSKTGYKPVLVAHNAQFEVKCLQNLAAGRFDLSKYFHGDKDFFGNFAPHYIDTLDLAKKLWAGNIKQTAYKLGDVLERAGIPIYDGHRAMNDVRPSSQFFEWVLKMLRAADVGDVLNQAMSVGEDGQIIKESRGFKFQFE